MDFQIAMWNWIIKLLGGFIPGITKQFPEWAGKIIFFVSMYLIINATMNHFFPPKPGQQIGVIEKYYAEPKRDVLGAGCNIMRAYAKIGIMAK